MAAELTQQQKRDLYDDGFAALPGVVPDELVHRAVRAINHSLGTQGLHPDALTYLRFRTYCPELSSSPAILDLLYQSPLWNIVQTAIGEGQVSKPTWAQIALRLPRADDPIPADEDVSPERLAPMTPHIDGAKRMPDVPLPQPRQLTPRAGDALLAHYMLGHGIAENTSPDIRYTVYFRFTRLDRDEAAGPTPEADSTKVSGFTALLGVQLSDLTHENGGNLTVWPGSHHLYESYFRDNIAETVADYLHPELMADIWQEWDGMRRVRSGAA